MTMTSHRHQQQHQHRARLARSLGDRCREVQVLRTATEAALALGAVRQAESTEVDGG